MSAPRAATSKGGKLLKLISFRIRVTLNDRRELVGEFMAYDSHMNLVIGDCVEYRHSGGANDRVIKRELGLTLVRGETVVSLTRVGDPPPEDSKKVSLIVERNRALAPRLPANLMRGPAPPMPANMPNPLGMGGGARGPPGGPGGPPPMQFGGPPPMQFGGPPPMYGAPPPQFGGPPPGMM
eukprot:TRINITY_DN1552_c0_g1_i1.p2 TRINITY_DN1552_c0_g1~~TRINITY_DN1552_c0_g1_i1.p2  ORF type:complete len:188 (-),score=42.57 TRINITY_DN1552_c0_g1_i1:236-778(-)